MGGGQIYGWFVILMVDESDLENITNQWINDIRLFNNEHIIQHHNIPQSNIPEEPCYISGMTPTGFINGQYESRCYVNLYFQVLFFNTFFRHLIMNIDCEKVINNLDDSEDSFGSYFQKIVILQVVQYFLCNFNWWKKNSLH